MLEYGKSLSISRKELWEDFVCVDPGIHTGIARFTGKELVSWNTISGKGKGWVAKYDSVVSQLTNKLLATHTVYVEWPGFQSAVARNTGSVIKLAYLIGKISMLHGNVVLVPVGRWKGQLPKRVTQARAERYFGIKGFTNHSSDAVGLGMWVIKTLDTN